MKTMKHILMLCALLVMTFAISNAQQIIGSFPAMDGGFEGQTVGTTAAASSITGTSLTWTNVGGTPTNSATINATGGRSGSKFITFISASTVASSHRRLQSPTTASGVIPISTAYTIQFYYKNGVGTQTTWSIRGGVSQGGTANAGYGSFVTNVNVGNTWTKYVGSRTTSSTAAAEGLGVISTDPLTNSGSMDYDDFVIYAGTEDLTVPDPATLATTPTITSRKINVSWTAPGAGVDGGGYMVVRGLADPVTTPNTNGIYALGNQVAAGEQVVYLGTTSSFDDLGLDPTTKYYYRIYTVDKAFNYSTSLAVNATTTTAPTPAALPTTQASDIVFSNVSQTSFTMTWTSGNGSNRVVLLREGSAINSNPQTGNTYSASTVFGNGTQIGSGNFVVYNGSGNSVTVTGLKKVSEYYAAVYEYNGASELENYMVPAVSSRIKTSPSVITSAATGLWGTAATWSPATVPTSSDSVVILNGHTITMDGTSSRGVYSLNVNSGGTITTESGNMNTVRYIQVYGTTVLNNGKIGVQRIPGDPGNFMTWDGVGLQVHGNVTVSGSGATSFARIRPGTLNVSLTLNTNVLLYVRSSTLGSSTALQFADGGSIPVPTAMFSNITVNNGDTLKFQNFSRLLHTNSADEDWNINTTVTINGVVAMGDSGTSIGLRSTPGNTINLIINGSVNTRSLIPSNLLNTNASTITVNNGGSFTVGNPNVTGSADFTNPNQFISGAGAFTLSNGTGISIGAPSGLEPVAGPIRTATRSFGNKGDYSFVGTVAQTTGSDVPTTVRSLTVNNLSGVTLSNNITIDSIVTMTKGALSLGTKVLDYNANATLLYNDIASQTTTNAEFPVAGGPKKLNINNALGVVLHASRVLDSSLTFTSGKLTTGANSITVKGLVITAGIGKFVDGALAMPVNAGPAVKKWDVGQSADYLPFTTALNSITGSDVISVSVLDRNTVASPGGVFSSASKVLRRYFRTAKGAGITAFTADSLILSYTNADVTEQGVGEDTLKVSLYSGSAWSPVTIARRDTLANTITVTGVTSFSDFVISGAQIVVSNEVTFQVNMKVQSRTKRFDPAKDTVLVRGNFYQGAGNWWEANNLKLTDLDGDSIYSGTFEVGVVPKRIGQFKFVTRGATIIGDNWEVDMGPNKDRTDTIPSTPWTLPVVWFNNDSTSTKVFVRPEFPLTFDSDVYDYSFSNFDGGSATAIANPQKNGINTSDMVGKMVKNAGQSWGGSWIAMSAPINFSENKLFKVKVFMPKIGAKLLLKVENALNGGINFEKEATGTVANAWEELTFDYSAIDTSKKYQKLVLIFDLGTAGDGSANFTYLFDDIRLTKFAPVLPLDFESAIVDYSFSVFSGATTSRIANPNSGGINTSGFVGKTIKGVGDDWAGSYITLSAPVDFSKGKFFKAKVYMPKVGAKLLFKLENLTNGGIAMELNTVATKANAWEELTWDFSAIDTTKQYHKVVLIFDLGTKGDGSANFTYLFDDVKQSLTLTGVGQNDNTIVTKYELLQNYPNPFNPTTNIDFALLTSGWVNLTVYNVVGQKVATLVNQHMEAGRHYTSFNAANLTSGVYFYKITTGKFTSIKKMMLLK